MSKLWVVVVACLLLVAAAPYLAPHDPLESRLERRLEPPSREYLLGTDYLGRCQLSRVFTAAPRSLGVAFLIAGGVNAIAFAFAVIGVFGGRFLDRAVNALINVFISFPSLVFALAVVGIAGPSLLAVAFAILWAWWPAEARIARSLLYSARAKDYVDAAILSGLSIRLLLWRHIMPQVAPALAVRFSLEVAGVVLALSTLGFLGLGTQPPQPEWGMMLADARPYVGRWPHLLLGPGLALILSTLACNLIAETLRRRLDQRTLHGW
jgi:ABC-type dipeptide/oligopeptide/nickel transport system permease subunit